MAKEAIWTSHAPVAARPWGGAVWGRDAWDGLREAGRWPDAPTPRFSWSLNGGFSVLQDVSLPRRLGQIGELGEATVDPDVGLGHMVEVAVVDAEASDPLVVFRGHIEGYAVEAGASRERVSGIVVVPLSARLRDSFYVGPKAFTATDPADMMRWFVERGHLPGFSWDAASGTVGATYTHTFERQSIGQIFDFCRLLAGSGWNYLLTRDNTVLFEEAPDAADHALVIGQHVSSVEFTKDATQRKTRVYVYGTGVSSVRTAPEHDPMHPLDLVVTEDRIATQAVADAVAQTLLDTHNQVQFRATAVVVDSNGPANSAPRGYDLEALKPGDTAQIVDPENLGQVPHWGHAVWGDDYWDGSPAEMSMQVLTIARMDYDFDTASLELATQQPSEIESVADLADQLQRHLTGSLA